MFEVLKLWTEMCRLSIEGRATSSEGDDSSHSSATAFQGDARKFDVEVAFSVTFACSISFKSTASQSSFPDATGCCISE